MDNLGLVLPPTSKFNAEKRLTTRGCFDSMLIIAIMQTSSYNCIKAIACCPRLDP